MTLEVLEAYANAKVKIKELESIIKNLSKEIDNNKKKVFIEDIVYLSVDKESVFTITDKEPEIIKYLKELKNEKS